MAKGTIVVSLRSKGLPSFTRSIIFDFRYQAVQLATEFLDLFFAFVVSIACLSWSAWISIGIIIATIAAAQGTSYTASTEVVLVFFMYIVLPLTVLLILVFSRRDRALRSLSEFKATFVSLLLSRPAGTTAAQRDASDELYRRAATFIEDVRQYLQHRRPYARHFFLPYRSSTPSPTDELLKVSKELGLCLRRVHRGVRDMHVAVGRLRETGVSEPLVLALESKVSALHAATERLSSIKEMRTPVVLRATFRWLVVVVIPVAMGPFWNQVSLSENNRTFAGILGVLSHIALLGILDTVVAMEDPFDDTALDAISLFEVLDQVGVPDRRPVMRHVSRGQMLRLLRFCCSYVWFKRCGSRVQMTMPASDGDGYDTEGLGLGRDFSGGGGGGGGGGNRGVEASNGGAGHHHPMAHVAMYISGGGGGGGEGVVGTAGDGTVSPVPMPPPSVADSAGGVSSVGPLEQQTAPVPQMHRHGASYHHHHHQQQQVSGIPAMRSSIVTSETAVGPPSAMMEPSSTALGVGGGGVGGGGGGGGGAGFGGVPSITSPALPDVGAAIRMTHVPQMPPMPALAGSPLYRTGAVVH
ncbi:hypothetical protein VOLCADRAFT_99269 [Volvox carteri f. nagariensis]|uniref:Uncharacterized protein n=1 Tax=Volvox carteri f. nagariensis TaxID=3068 RepID=D8UHD4_VOLCA|nr:uncharacterized protein VOLCADRAFT_99269 [Volvox carteri f. nagariensis]EFJ40885.1 hypothetical protein VOLCADRAFT_99269 [Volvox carteri f. nagariensis]|eukprot:XP_002958045.1 hypothetical protein VOLCADRAFT_99269 [Volvox carteri f. nagariensis]